MVQKGAEYIIIATTLKTNNDYFQSHNSHFPLLEIFADPHLLKRQGAR